MATDHPDQLAKILPQLKTINSSQQMSDVLKTAETPAAAPPAPAPASTGPAATPPKPAQTASHTPAAAPPGNSDNYSKFKTFVDSIKALPADQDLSKDFPGEDPHPRATMKALLEQALKKDNIPISQGGTGGKLKTGLEAGLKKIRPCRSASTAPEKTPLQH